MISAVVLTKNEEENISECIKCLKFSKDIVVVDDNSTDKTVLIARKHGAKVYKRDMEMNYAEQSNFAMKKTRGDWVLFVDADERVSEILEKEILEKISIDTISGFYVKRKDYIWGKRLKYGEIGAFKSLRLVRKGSGKWIRRVHPFFDVQGKTQTLINPLFHYPHKDLFKFFESINRWSTWHALANNEEGKRSSLFKVVVWPLAHFSRNFILRLGFLDGIEGFVFAIVMSFHSFLAWGKVWMLQKGSTKI